MEQQGTPIGQSYTGAKVTSDPSRYTNPRTEGSGAVASDSLAAESAQGGGKFSENRGSQPLGVSGSKSTFNNTDTSGAAELYPASDAESRLSKGDYTPSYGAQYSSGKSGGTGSGNSGGGNAAAASGSSSFTNADPAPNYVTPVVNSLGSNKPKGTNITEGGFDSDPSKNASFNSDIGTSNDPARGAEFNFQNRTTAAPGKEPLPSDRDARRVHEDEGLWKGGQPYGALGTDQSA